MKTRDLLLDQEDNKNLMEESDLKKAQIDLIDSPKMVHLDLSFAQLLIDVSVSFF